MHAEPISYTFVTMNASGAVVRHRAGLAEQLLFAIGKGQQLAMLSLHGGTFLMGSPEGEGFADKKPRHDVLMQPFLFGRFPVTQAQWTAVMGDEKACWFCGPNKAMHNVNLPEASEFCRRISDMIGHHFRLPAETEWEFACRGGTTAAFSCGPSITADLANYNGEFTYLEAPRGPYRHVLLDVGAFPPNPFGLHDMHGNLWEWCADPWHVSYDGAPQDGRVWDAGGSERYCVARGGSWHETPDLCRSAVRLKLPCDEGDEMVGFRAAATR